MRFFRFASLLFLLLAGCSRLKMAYELAPWYLEKEAKKALPELNAEQAKRLKQDLQAYFRWHRREMLPSYTEALQTLANGLTASAGARSSQRLAGPLLNGLWTQTVEPLIKPSAALLASLDAAQIEAFRIKLMERSKRQHELYLVDPEKAFQRRFKKLRDYLEDFTGKLNPGQLARFEELSRGFVIPYQAWIDHKAEQQDELLRLLSEKRSSILVQAHLRDWWLSPRSGGEWKEAWQWDEKAEADYVKGILTLLYPVQRQRAATRLEAMARELEGILPGPEPAPRPTMVAPSPLPSPSPQATTIP